MAKQESVTKSQIAEFSVRDVIRTIKKNAKAIRILQKIGGTKPSIKEAILAIGQEQEKLKQFAMQGVAKQIELALTDDED